MTCLSRLHTPMSDGTCGNSTRHPSGKCVDCRGFETLRVAYDHAVEP